MNSPGSIRMRDSDLCPNIRGQWRWGFWARPYSQLLLIKPLAFQEAIQLCLTPPLRTFAAPASPGHRLIHGLPIPGTASEVLCFQIIQRSIFPGSRVHNLRHSQILDCTTPDMVQFRPHILQTPSSPPLKSSALSGSRPHNLQLYVLVLHGLQNCLVLGPTSSNSLGLQSL